MPAFRPTLQTIVHKRDNETQAEKRARAEDIAVRLAQAYPEIKVPLRHDNTFQLLVATILSAQCTDEAVNKVTPKFFRCYPVPEKLAQARIEGVEKIIRSLGLFRTKAKSLKECARQLTKEFRGEVPATMAELTRLPGVGRKTANVILGYVFDTPGVVADTHCRRLSRRLRLTRQTEPDKIKKSLMRLLPPKQWTAFSHRLMVHGRRVCHARKPGCRSCNLSDLCPSAEI